MFARAGSAAERQQLASRLARRIFDALARDGEVWHVNRSRFVINLRRGHGHFGEGDPPVQIVLRLYDSPTEVLLGFDVDCCCVGYDGQHVWALPRVRAVPHHTAPPPHCTRRAPSLHPPCPHTATAVPPTLHPPSHPIPRAPTRAQALRALRHGVVVCNPLHSWPNQPTYELRLAKYAARGFAVAVPGLNLESVNVLRATSEAPPHTSLYLPVSPHTSLYLPISPCHLRGGAAQAARRGAAAPAARRAPHAPQAVGAVGQADADPPRAVRAG